MNNSLVKRLLQSSLIGILIIGVSACSFAGSKDLSQEEMEEEIKQAFLLWDAADSGTFNIDVVMDVESDEKAAVDGTVVEKQSLALDFDIAGKSLMVDREKNKSDLEVVLTGTGALNEDEPQAIGASFVFKENNLYFILEDFPTITTGDFASANAMISVFKDKWWSVPVPEEVFNEQFSSLSLFPAEGAELTEEQKQIKELYDSAKFFETISYEGTESYGGVKSKKYSVTLDQEGIFDYMVSYGEITGDPMSVEDQQSFKESFDTFDLDLTLFVGAKQKYLTGVDADISFESPDEASPGRGTIDMSFLLGGYNSKVEIETPEDATLFDIGALLGIPQESGFELNQ